MNAKKSILLTNDDGIDSLGIKVLAGVLSRKHSIFVAAPDVEQSGVGHSFTFNRTIHYEKTDESDVIQGYRIHGSPSDCVKFAISYLMEKRPDIIVSGINLGENSGLSAFYSGTVAAAREGAFWGIPSFAFSVCGDSEKYIEEYASMIPDIISKILSAMKDSKEFLSTFYNVNFPLCPVCSIRGIKITWQSMAFYDDRYKRVEVQSHKTGEGFLVYGEKKELEPFNSYDSRALLNNYITVTPLTFDSTSYTVIPHLQWLEDDTFFKR